MLTERRIIGRVGKYQIAGAVREVQLRDGSIIRLQVVHENGLQSPFIHAVHMGTGNSLYVFDARKFAMNLSADMPSTHARDVPGLITFSMRAVFPNAEAFRRAIAGEHLVCGAPAPELEAA